MLRRSLHWIALVSLFACTQVQAYQLRAQALDPIDDQQVTCEEMRQFPERVFANRRVAALRLAQPPYAVDYTCAESLEQQPFMQKLLGLAHLMRGDGGPPMCRAPITLPLQNYGRLHLTAAGFAPQLYLRERKQQAVPGNPGWNRLANTDKRDSSVGTFRHLQQWSEKSRTNFNRYAAFSAEFDRVLPQLARHYERQFGIAAADAPNFAQAALMFVPVQVLFSYPGQTTTPDTFLVRLARDENATAAALRRALDAGVSDGSPYSQDDMYRALTVALLNNRTLPMVATLAEALPAQRLQNAIAKREPLLSFAIGSTQNLQYLLNRQVPVDASNSFGKTTLFYAIESGPREAVETLLQAGAKVNQPFKSAKELRPNDEPCIYPDLQHTRRTPLMHAAQNSDTRMLGLLLRAGAQPDAVDDLGFNALDYAAMGNKEDNALYLRSLGLAPGATQ